jgi:alpha-L-rhamnosidase
MPDCPRMLPQTLEKIRDLVKAGATIIGNQPAGLATLVNENEARTRLNTAVEELWNPSSAGARDVIRHVGKGRVIEGLPLEQALTHLAITPDVTGGKALWLHRCTAGADWYFVCPPAGQAFKGTLSFRSTGVVELWNPVTGQVKSIPGQREGARTRVALDLAQAESCFVVFRKEIRDSEPSTRAASEFQQCLALNGPWTLQFPKGWGAPESVQITELKAWKDLPLSDEARAFSGTATYTTTFTLPSLEAKVGYQLDLGAVDMTARVTLNGKSLGLLWCEPYTLDISGALQQGENKLTVEVTSTWHNRLVYDAGLPEGERKTWTIEGPKKGSGLSTSGLLGPVVIQTGDGKNP